MTTIFGKEIECAVCGSKNEFSVIGSTNAMGSPDLDLRPPEMQRSTIDTWIQECSECGYCFEDVSELVSNAAEIITSDKYEMLGTDRSFPKLARQFLKYACLVEGENRLDSAMAHLWAAWVCDDEDRKSAEARVCREMAMLDMSCLLPHPDSEEGVSNAAIHIDMLRRTEKYSEAVNMIEKLLDYQSLNDVVRAVLEFQLDRCSKSDNKCYTVADAYNE